MKTRELFCSCQIRQGSQTRNSLFHPSIHPSILANPLLKLSHSAPPPPLLPPSLPRSLSPSLSSIPHSFRNGGPQDTHTFLKETRHFYHSAIPMLVCSHCTSSHIEHDSATGQTICQACNYVCERLVLGGWRGLTSPFFMQVLEENAIVSEVTFSETASGASVLQGQVCLCPPSCFDPDPPLPSLFRQAAAQSLLPLDLASRASRANHARLRFATVECV